MKKTYKIEVDCAACAQKVEDAAQNVEGIIFLSVNYMTQKMTVEFADDADEKKIMKAVEKAGKKVEDDFMI